MNQYQSIHSTVETKSSPPSTPSSPAPLPSGHPIVFQSNAVDEKACTSVFKPKMGVYDILYFVHFFSSKQCLRNVSILIYLFLLWFQMSVQNSLGWRYQDFFSQPSPWTFLLLPVFFCCCCLLFQYMMQRISLYQCELMCKINTYILVGTYVRLMMINTVHFGNVYHTVLQFLKVVNFCSCQQYIRKIVCPYLF